MGNSNCSFSDKDEKRMIKELDNVTDIQTLESWVERNRSICKGSIMSCGELLWKDVEGML
jgi:hypothetical protein